MNRLRVAERLVALLVPGAHVVQPAYEPVIAEVADTFGGLIYVCGSGPEKAMGHEVSNPNWLYWRAANLLAIADRIRKDQP